MFCNRFFGLNLNLRITEKQNSRQALAFSLHKWSVAWLNIGEGSSQMTFKSGFFVGVIHRVVIAKTDLDYCWRSNFLQNLDNLAYEKSDSKIQILQFFFIFATKRKPSLEVLKIILTALGKFTKALQSKQKVLFSFCSTHHGSNALTEPRSFVVIYVFAKKLSFQEMMDEIKSVVLERIEFDCRQKPKLLPFSGIYSLSEIPCNEQFLCRRFWLCVFILQFECSRLKLWQMRKKPVLQFQLFWTKVDRQKHFPAEGVVFLKFRNYNNGAVRTFVSSLFVKLIYCLNFIFINLIATIKVPKILVFRTVFLWNSTQTVHSNPNSFRLERGLHTEPKISHTKYRTFWCFQTILCTKNW